jgi:hypothetical protein
MAAKTRSRPPAASLKADEPTLTRLEELGQIQCTTAEAACILGVSSSTLTRLFANHPKTRAAFDSGRGRGLEALRRAQFKLAETNATMAMFLGKNYLDQTDRREMDQSGANDVSQALQRLRDKLAVAALGSEPTL